MSLPRGRPREHDTCTLEGCSQPHHARGLCHPHYKSGAVAPHTCPECNKTFSTTQAMGGHRNAHKRKPTGCATEDCRNRRAPGRRHCGDCISRAAYQRQKAKRAAEAATEAPTVHPVPPHRFTLGSLWLPPLAQERRKPPRTAAGSRGATGRASGAPRPSGEERRPWPTLPRADAWARTEQAGWGCAA